MRRVMTMLYFCVAALAFVVAAETHAAAPHSHQSMGYFSKHHHESFGHLCDFVVVATEYITFFGTFVLIIGVILSAANMFLVLLNNFTASNFEMIMVVSYHSSKEKQVASFGRVRLQLGEVTALGLEILVVADILETLSKLETEEYSWDALGKIGAVAAFRTVLAYMLGKEVTEIKEKIHEEAEHQTEHHPHSDDKHAESLKKEAHSKKKE